MSKNNERFLCFPKRKIFVVVLVVSGGYCLLVVGLVRFLGLVGRLLPVHLVPVQLKVIDVDKRLLAAVQLAGEGVFEVNMSGELFKLGKNNTTHFAVEFSVLPTVYYITNKTTKNLSLVFIFSLFGDALKSYFSGGFPYVLRKFP